MWLNDFRGRFEPALHNLLWRQWTRLGVPGAIAAEDRWLLDPEALLLFSLESARSEPRLFDEVLDWLLVNGALIDVQRLRNLHGRDAAYPRGLLEAAASWVLTADPSAKWQRLASAAGEPGPGDGTALVRDSPSTKRAGPPEQPLFLPLGGASLPPGGSRDPHFSRFGYARSPFRPRRHAQPPPTAHPTCLRLRLRGIFGIGIRSEVLAHLALRGTATGPEIAEAAGFSSAATQQLLRELTAAGLLTARPRGRERLYVLNVKRWGEIFAASATPTDSAGRGAGEPTGGWSGPLATTEVIDWLHLFRAFTSILRFLRRPDLAGCPEAHVDSEFRPVLEDVCTELQEARLPFDVPELSGASPRRQTELLLRAVEELLRWMRIELPPQPAANGVSPGERALRIADRLDRLVSPAAATFYRECLRLQALDPPLASGAHVVAHLATEIDGSVRDVLLGAYPLDPSLAKEAERGKESHKTQVQHLLARLGVLASSGPAEAWLRTVPQQHERRHRNALMPPRRADEELVRFWEDSQVAWDAVLQALEDRFLAVHGLVADLARISQPTPKDARRLANGVPQHSYVLRHFFSALESAGWVVLLNARGYFREHAAAGRDCVFRPEMWQYLLRVAHDAPQDVAEAVRQLQGLTDPAAIRWAAQVVGGLPEAFRGDLVEVVARMVERCDERYARWEVADLVPKAIEAGATDSAFKLAAALLRGTGEGTSEAADDDLIRGILEKAVPSLEGVDRDRAISLLSDCLEAYLRTERKNRSVPHLADASFIWYPDLAATPNPSYRSTEVSLLTCLRDACERLVRKEPDGTAELVERLEARGWWVFRRIGLHLLAVFPDQAPAAVVARLLDADLVRGPWARAEYVRLLEKGFVRLSAAEKERWRQLLAAGLGGARRSNAKERADVESAWRAHRFAPIAHLVPKAWKKAHPEWFANLPAATAATEMPGGTLREVSQLSPRSAHELLALGMEKIVGFLQSWEPAPDASPLAAEGLASQLRKAVETEPEPFARGARGFEKIGSRFVFALLDGLRHAARAKRTIAWEPVLGLCRTLIASGEATHEPAICGTGESPLGPAAGRPAHAVADLVSEGLVDRPSQIPVDLRKTVWAILSVLSRDADPAPEREGVPPWAATEPAEISLNCVRGVALHAVIRYALWVRRSGSPGTTGGTERPVGLEDMPEVRDVLDAHLDPGRDGSLAVRAVYGQWFPWLFRLDPAWTRANADRIFSSRPEDAAFEAAAWDAYVVLCPPYDPILPVLLEAYVRAVERLGRRRSSRAFTAGMDPELRLAEHLMAFYGRGRLELDEREGILRRFFSRAPAGVRAHALEFVGQSLRGAGEGPPGEVLQRFRVLWEHRSGTPAGEELRPSLAELRAFRWWFVCGRFDDRWAVEQLQRSLGHDATGLDVDRLVVERLARLGTTWPAEVMACLELLAEGAGPDWHVRSWATSGAAILDALERAADEAIQQRARKLRSRLVARGFDAFAPATSAR